MILVQINYILWPLSSSRRLPAKSAQTSQTLLIFGMKLVLPHPQNAVSVAAMEQKTARGECTEAVPAYRANGGHTCFKLASTRAAIDRRQKQYASLGLQKLRKIPQRGTPWNSWACDHVVPTQDGPKHSQSADFITTRQTAVLKGRSCDDGFLHGSATHLGDRKNAIRRPHSVTIHNSGEFAPPDMKLRTAPVRIWQS
jgi:hypothetical protein